MVPLQPLKIAFSTLACPDWSWHDVLRHGPAFGYQGVEMRLLNRETNLLAIAELQPQHWNTRQQELRNSGFQVCGLASSIRLDETSAAARSQQLETGRRYLELSAALGARFIRVFGDVLPPESALEERQTAFRWIAEGLQQLGDLARPYNIQILLETHGDFSASVPSAEVMQFADHAHVGLVWDTHHPWRFHGEELAVSWNRLKRWTRHTHWKDSVLLPEANHNSEQAQQAGQAAAALMAGHRHADYVLFLGGEFPSCECLQLLLNDGYDGWHSLEWEKMWHPELLGPEVALPLFPRKLQFLADTLA